jgi:hypothetical protein
MSRRPGYPFVPKSNRWMEPGQFWAVPLADGRFACGRVLAKPADFSPQRSFVAGLMDWVGTKPPTASDLAGRGVLDSGGAHIVTILDHGGEILGERALELDGLVAPEPDSTWGPDVIVVAAEFHFGSGGS